MKYITLAHGNGGRFMRELITEVFAKHLHNPVLNVQADAVSLPLASSDQEIMFTTDSFTVKPLEFPGGDIGSLAVHGTVNDLAVSGAMPKYLSLNAILEEGLSFEVLDRIVRSLAQAARDAGVVVAAGDTKVVPRGEGSGVYLATTGVGLKPNNLYLGLDQIQDGDVILVSGPVGDHGIAVMLAREQFGLHGELQSDSANVIALTQALVTIPGLRFMRDPTRGGLAGILCEVQQATGLGVRVHGPSIPIRDPVISVCEMLGYDPLYLACEGRVVAIVAAEQAQAALAALQAQTQGRQAAIIGSVNARDRHVVLETELGGERMLEELEDDPLPRIC
ncbi:MAG: hydrogenase expression/formation protein HypE [Gammaproteobacteria bacterium]|nr:hydrogenase expression/formation protein HypE [Gammaproteobacteria bacterium]